MSKLLVSLSLAVLVFGIGLFIFRGGGGVENVLIEGHTSIRDTIRSFDYVTD